MFLPPNRILYSIIALLIIQTSIAQSVGIGTASPNSSARLEVSSTTQGILIPTLSTAQRNAISNPATGLLVFQTDGTQGFYYYNGRFWINLTHGSPPDSDGIAVSPSYGLTTTFAGSGSAGSADGIGTAASFTQPVAIAIDHFSGNLFVAEWGNNRITKIIPQGGIGAVSTFASLPGGFVHLSGIALDASGNIYATDYSNPRVHKITPGGTMSILAGSGSPGSDDDIGAAASFRTPGGLAVDASGNVYVADFGNNKIRKITPNGVVSTFAGGGPGTSTDATGIGASFWGPRAVAIDASGNVYVADSHNNKIRKIAPGAVVTTFAGTGLLGSADGPGATASFNNPTAVTIDASGNIYVADRNNNKIRKITPGGIVSTFAGGGSGSPIDGIGTSASFNHPEGIAADAFGNIYVTEYGGHRIRKIIAQ
jgi:sugar lactone lactonase YvrE